MNDQRGFSLVEVMMAMVILTVGVLALAASSATVSKLTVEGNRMSAAAAAASSQLETLRAGDCNTLAAGTSTAPGGFSLSWTVATSGLVKTVTLTVSYSGGRSTRSSAFTTQVSCAPAAG